MYQTADTAKSLTLSEDLEGSGAPRIDSTSQAVGVRCCPDSGSSRGVTLTDMPKKTSKAE